MAKWKARDLAALLASGAIFGGVLWLQYEPQPDDNLTCIITSREGQTPVQLGRLRGPIEGITLSGLVAQPYEDRHFRLDGKAQVRIGGAELTANARGRVFLDEADSIDTMMLALEHPDFGRGGLRLITLNEQGSLDENSSELFAFTSPAFKQAHPMDYHCDLSHLPEQRELREF